MSDVNNLNDLIHAKVRLGVMSLLMTYEKCDFIFLKKTLSITDGNLGSHLKKLEDANYIKTTKTFSSKRPKTTAQITDIGVEEYKKYINTVEAIIKNNI